MGVHHRMHLHILLPALLACFPLFSYGAPSPQGDPNDDVEVLSGGPVSTNDYDYSDNDYSGFGGIDDLLRGLFGIGSSTQDTQDSGSGSGSEEESECGYMCTIFKDLFNFEGIQQTIDAVRDQENEIDGDFDEDGFAVNNSTHTKKVLPDGSVVHINKTLIADTDDNGNSFVIHRSVIHTFEGDVEVDEVEEVEPVEEDAAKPTEESVESFMKKEDTSTGVDDGLKF